MEKKKNTGNAQGQTGTTTLVGRTAIRHTQTEHMDLCEYTRRVQRIGHIRAGKVKGHG